MPTGEDAWDRSDRESDSDEAMRTECGICSGYGIETYCDDPEETAGWVEIDHDADRDGLEVYRVWACPECIAQTRGAS